MTAHRCAQDFVYGIAGGCTGFIHVNHRLLAQGPMGCCGGLLQRCTHPLQAPDDRRSRQHDPQHLLQQRLTPADAQGEGSPHQRDQGTEPWAVAAHVHSRRQRGAGAGGAAGADQAMQPMLDHQRCDRRDLDQLMAQRIWILSRKQRAATAAGIEVVVHHLIHPLDRQQLRPCAGMARLTAALRPLPLRRSGGLNPGPSLEGGLEELRELRPIRSRRLASSVARAVSWLRSSSFSCCWARMKARTATGVASQSASAIPAGGLLITGGL